jgi:hypothetical protein
MKPPEINQTTFQGRPANLARLFSLDERSDALWTPEEIGAIWQHQLSACIQSELSPETPASPLASHPKDQHAGKDAVAPRSAPLSHSPQPKTFGELFAEPNPSLELLKQTKNLAKRMVKDATDKQFKDVAAALYYASYAAGLVRDQKRLGGLGDEDLKRGFKWLLAQTWLDESTHNLIAQAKELLKS